MVRLLAEAGLRGDFACEGLSGGANNRVYRVECGGQRVLLKAYFQHPHDPRDRLDAEFSFCRFAWDQGLRCVPRPLASDRTAGLGLYEFVEGRRLSAGEIGIHEVQQALDFYCALNRHKTAPAARALARGSEACFTLSEHLACVERRIAALATIDSTIPANVDAAAFVGDQLTPVWQRVKSRFTSQAARRNLPLDQAIPEPDRCLSPSDFGFHNAILATDGRLRFIDFEYSGWDDPAKMVCDFFCQPAVPVPADCFGPFVARVTAGLSDPELHAARVELLRPVYGIKWCCIMLNEFLPAGRQRRAFAREAWNEDERKRGQLQKARSVLVELQVFGVD